MGAGPWSFLLLAALLALTASAAVLPNSTALLLPSVSRMYRPRTYNNEAYLPTEPWANTADPTARVFNGRVFVYVAWDHAFACGRRWASPRKKQGSQRFCMVGYRTYSTDDPSLRGRWVSHGPALIEEAVPWAFRGGRGYRGAARLWAPCVVRGDNGKYYLFFPAPNKWDSMAIGVAESWNPEGPFRARSVPIKTPFAIDPSVVRLPNGRWVMFSSSKAGVYVQTLDKGFWRAGRRVEVRGLEDGYKEGPFAFVRGGRLVLQYARFRQGEGYTIRQAVARDANNPGKGFRSLGVAIGSIDGETNHGSVVTFNQRSWAFYHRHMERAGAAWKVRKAVFRSVYLFGDGRQKPIYPPRTRK